MRSATFAHLGKEVSFVVHDRDYISNVLVHGKMFFESEILEYIRTTFPAQKTVVDVGANIGNHSRYFLEFLSPTRLVAFEPFPPNLELLKQNIASDRTEIFPYGLGAHARVTGIRFNPENLGICVLDDNLPAVIEIKTLDSFQLNDVTLLKVDV
ncbi:MAG: FkbM family methyltransferase, partial [Deltaproteobacteria bacterium]|nr:FkbM family methyltransferase [Deltaproteobacteria bacterium]